MRIYIFSLLHKTVFNNFYGLTTKAQLDKKIIFFYIYLKKTKPYLNLAFNPYIQHFSELFFKNFY
jgi:hypothetical protein